MSETTKETPTPSPSGDVWPEIVRLKGKIAELQQQKRNCIEIIDDDLKEKAELKAEVERLKAIKPITLTIQPYSYECGERCCYECGETWSVDGVEVAHGPCEHNRMKQLLSHLGFDAEIVGKNEDGEEVWGL